jgi:hypothetical protein
MCHWRGQCHKQGERGGSASAAFRTLRRAARWGDAAACCSLLTLVFGRAGEVGEAAGEARSDVVQGLDRVSAEASEEVGVEGMAGAADREKNRIANERGESGGDAEEGVERPGGEGRKLQAMGKAAREAREASKARGAIRAQQSTMGRDSMRDGREGISLEMVQVWLSCAESGGGHAGCLAPLLPRIRHVLASLGDESARATAVCGSGASAESAHASRMMRCCWVGWRQDCSTGSSSGWEWT